ncbi:ADP-ribosylglycohydrolase family protein [Limnofasciculus baicalensis]|uniref:ADP-ribosylglycohydrolase family protein n=1 Tax=Limnofasciculus baicalensis BBK-W-15 TaxID=2699891 RepID=A0AAE3GRV9_9CYAN|nr:ADP-ribosylglycohydrolase family protein [Limnofasciculus baicalensis]MCP2728723.1 ADP-ribosylglycohydrolase family protein [Limnofasciculus baicalensis BBK-W-15]
MTQTNSKTLAGLLGVCVGDALGVPVEFTSRDKRTKSPVISMEGYGTYNQPPGTWSDDSSLTFCLAESLCSEFSLDTIAQSFCRWYNKAYWTPHGKVFDIGGTTCDAIENLLAGVSPVMAGGADEWNNANGSLMRILPLAYYHKSLNFSELIERVHQVSSITHRNPRCQMACGIYISIAINLLQGDEPTTAYLQGIEAVRDIYNQLPYSSEIHRFSRVFSGEIHQLPVEEIKSGGYVIDSLEAAIWCFLNSTSYSEAVLKAVNLGGDTDTTAAITGGLAGIYYGVANIPTEWINLLARKEDIIDLAGRLEAAIYS